MNEKIKGFFKKNRIWFIVIAILLVWGGGATIYGVNFRGKYIDLQSVIANADGGELIKSVQQHGETITAVHDDIVATRIELQSALGRTAELEQRIERATGYAELTDAELVDFGKTMASSGNTLQDAINLQQRTIEFARRIQTNNSAIKVELGVRP